MARFRQVSTGLCPGDIERSSRDALEKVDDCTAATRASREFAEITTVQASIDRYRVNAGARKAPASRPRIAEMIMRRARMDLIPRNQARTIRADQRAAEISGRF